MPMRVLFVGDSLTYVNDLDLRVGELAAAAGQPIDIEVLFYSSPND
jgi:hypothetical protein